MRQVHHLVQGSPEWKAHRATPGMINGSEIAAIMGIDPNTSRSEMLRMKALGGEKEFSDYVQKHVIDKGHENEALARPMAEEIIGDDLSPLVMTDEIGGLLFSVSLDGITQCKSTTHEHKSLNKDYVADIDAGRVPSHHRPQCEAGLMVSGATRCLFMASTWDDDGNLIEEKHCWYESNQELRQRMIASCKQFAEDLANYQHVETKAAPVAATIEALPALMVQVEGKVLATNLDAFKQAAQTFIDGIKTELVNDQDFADADKMVKFLKDGEERLALAKDQALAQTASIDELFRTVDAISEQMRSKRLALDKLVKAEKENRRAEIVNEARKALGDHYAALARRVGVLLPAWNQNIFADAIKGLKSIDSMRDKVSTALANAKIEANAIADRIQDNKASLDGDPPQYGYWMFLFPDFASVCTKAREDFSAVRDQRIAKHEEQQAAERERIRQEEATRLEREAQAKQNAQEVSVAAGRSEGVAQEAPALSKEPTGEASMPGGSVATGTKGIVPTDLTAQPVSPVTDESIIDDYLRLKACSPADKKALRLELLAFVKYQQARELSAAA